MAQRHMVAIRTERLNPLLRAITHVLMRWDASDWPIDPRLEEVVEELRVRYEAFTAHPDDDRMRDEVR